MGKGNIKEEMETPEAPTGYTFYLPNDKRPTVVEIEGKIYDLVPTGQTLRDLVREKDFSKVPHCRYLNPIRILSKREQEEKNGEQEKFHTLFASSESISTPTKATSVKKAVAMGINIPDEIKRLMAEKERLLKAGKTDEAKKIRKQLRNLDYKRYIKE